MKDIFKNRNLTILVFGVLLLILGYTFALLTIENSKCIANPLVYGAKKASDAGTPIYCSCRLDQYGQPKIYFDNETLKAIEPSVLDNLPNYNLNLNLS